MCCRYMTICHNIDARTSLFELCLPSLSVEPPLQSRYHQTLCADYRYPLRLSLRLLHHIIVLWIQLRLPDSRVSHTDLCQCFAWRCMRAPRVLLPTLSAGGETVVVSDSLYSWIKYITTGIIEEIFSRTLLLQVLVAYFADLVDPNRSLWYVALHLLLSISIVCLLTAGQRAIWPWQTSYLVRSKLKERCLKIWEYKNKSFENKFRNIENIKNTASNRLENLRPRRKPLQRD